MKIKSKSIFSVFFPLFLVSGIVSAETWPPKVPFHYGLGMDRYQALCASCHGKWGDGSEQGPPLLHPYYKSSHHSDASFHRAIMKGAKAHHWKFGDMEPVKDARPEDVKSIILFVRWLQRQKGIE